MEDASANNTLVAEDLLPGAEVCVAVVDLGLHLYEKEIRPRAVCNWSIDRWADTYENVHLCNMLQLSQRRHRAVELEEVGKGSGAR